MRYVIYFLTEFIESPHCLGNNLYLIDNLNQNQKENLHLARRRFTTLAVCYLHRLFMYY